MRLPSRTALPFPPHRILRLTVWSGVLCMATVIAQTGPTPGRAVIVAEVDGVIHPITSEFMRGAISRADSEDAAALVFVLRTPGGLVDSTRDIISRMLDAKTPIVVWVGPSGLAPPRPASCSRLRRMWRRWRRARRSAPHIRLARQARPETRPRTRKRCPTSPPTPGRSRPAAAATSRSPRRPSSRVAPSRMTKPSRRPAARRRRRRRLRDAAP